MKKQNFAALFVAGLLAVLPLLGFAPATKSAEAASPSVAVAPGYDYSRFKNDKITLNVYNWGEYMSLGVDGEGLNVNAEFEALTGIRVNYTNFDTNEALYSKLKSGGAEYDVIIPSDYMVGKLIREDMLAPLNFQNIPNYKMIGEAYKNQPFDPKNQYSVPYTWGYVGIVYNQNLVEDAPDSWNIFWNEQYTGDILMFDNSRDAFGIAAKKLGQSLNPSTTKEIDEQAAALAEQKKLVQAYVMDQIFDKMEGGEAAVAPYYAGDAIVMMQENPSLAFAIPKEGTNFFIDSACIPKNSAHQEAAEMYINFLCETSIAAENSLYIGYSTPQVEAEASLPEEVRNNPIAYPSAAVMANMESFQVLPDELNTYMDKAWSDMKSYSEGGSGWLVVVLLVLAVALIIGMYCRKHFLKKRNDY